MITESRCSSTLQTLQTLTPFATRPSWSTIDESKIQSVKNSNEVSRKLKGLQNYVRLSFNDQNPMQYVALKANRVKKLYAESYGSVVARPGVLFSDCNATRNDAVLKTNPSEVHFDVVKVKEISMM